MTSLPIDTVLPEFIAMAGRNPSVVLQAPPGAGKTTRIPVALLDRIVRNEGLILVLQPRRVAARAVARRMATERSSRVGEEVGYQVRFDQRVTPRTKIIVMTAGIMVRRLQEDPFLEGVAAVVFDEFHERHLDGDLALGMCRRVQQTVRPDLRLVIMSATLAPGPISAYLGNCPIVVGHGSAYPVTIRYATELTDQPLAIQAARAVDRLLHETSGDLLVFLPGVREIRQTQDELRRRTDPDDLVVMPLYGDLSAEQQDRVFDPVNGRKVVLATNVAETSITIPGITGVVDTGQARRLEFDTSSGLNRLELRPISKASADQRAGRAGRTAPGTCLRLWPEAAQRTRLEHEPPEVHCVDLAGAVLQLTCWGEADVRQFPWFEAPAEAALSQADHVLRRLEALDDRGATKLGHQLACIPAHPRLARLLVEGARIGEPRRAALMAALLSERDPFRRPDRPRRVIHASRSDLLDRVEALEEFERTGRIDFDLGSLQRGSAEAIWQGANQLQRLISTSPAVRDRGEQESASHSPHGAADTEAGTRSLLLQALLKAFPDRLARRREPNSRKGIMAGGRGVRLADQSAVTEGDLFLCLDIDSSGADAFVRLASGVDRSWLPTARLTTRIDVEFDATQWRVQARRRVLWDDLVLDETPASLPDGERTSDVLAAAARLEWSRVFPADDLEVSGFVARVRCLSEWLPHLELPDFTDAQLLDLLPQVACGRRSFAELRQGPWLDTLRAQLTSHQLQMVDREAPSRVTVPSGSRVPVQYEVGRSPILAVRIQEIFGWRETPLIAAGRIRLLLHLLAPNHRPQQITDDLQSFWSKAYPTIRGELRRRYPKHAWPEDPLSATAEHRPTRR